jgi:hypothetical protein
MNIVTRGFGNNSKIVTRGYILTIIGVIKGEIHKFFTRMNTRLKFKTRIN